MPKNELTSKANTALSKNYQILLQELKSILAKGQYTAYKAVDNIKVQTYWQIGERIVREELQNKNRADYGKYLVESLVIDLKIERRELYRIIQFYRIYTIVGAVHPQLSWYHYRELIRIEDDTKRSFYETKTVQNSWGYRDLFKQIKAKLYENTSPQEIKAVSQAQLPAETSLEVFKDVLDFNPMGLELKDDERKMETKLGVIAHLG